MQVLPVHAIDAKLSAVAGLRAGEGPVDLPAGRSLLVLARNRGAGAYTLALSGVSGAPGA
jgi:hypothetical protein